MGSVDSVQIHARVREAEVLQRLIAAQPQRRNVRTVSLTSTGKALPATSRLCGKASSFQIGAEAQLAD